MLPAEGYATLKLDNVELGILQGFVRTQYFEALSREVPGQAHLFHGVPLDHYHVLSELIPHGTVWKKWNRILPKAAVLTIRGMPFMQTLERQFGEFQITNEEGREDEEVYWRIVRPRSPNDVGTLHADRWFWDLGHGTVPGHQRLKVWIPLWCEPGVSGLAVVPGSQLREWKFHGERPAGETRPSYQKPVIDERPDAHLLYTEPGTAILFHEGLLHGGINAGATKTRYSLEFMIWR